MDTSAKSDSFRSFELFGDGLLAEGRSASRPVSHIRLQVTSDAADSQDTATAKQIDVESHDLQPVKIAYIFEVLKNQLPEPLANLRATQSEDGTAEFELDSNDTDMEGLERMGQTLIDALLKISQNIKTVIHTFSNEKYTVAIKHFAYYFRRINSIKCFEDGEFKMLFAYTTDTELETVQQHVKIISDQPLDEAETQLDDDQATAIEGTMPNLGEVCAASLSLHEEKLLILGIREDVATAILELKKVVAGMVINTFKMDEFAMRLFDRESVLNKINDMDVITRWKLKWCIKDQTIYVVGKTDTHAESGVSAIKDFFRKITVRVTRKERGARGWDMFVKIVTVQCGPEIDIDDTDDNVVTICVTEPRYSQVVRHIEEKKSRWTLTHKRVVLKADICEFVMRHTKQNVLSAIDAEFLEFKQGNDGKTVEVIGIEDEVKAACDAINKVSQVVYGVPNEQAKIFLGNSGQDIADAVLKMHKENAQIIVKEGRIEDQTVDVIVNSTAYSLKLEQADNAISTAIYAKAGAKAQESVKDKIEELKREHIVAGDPGNLQCKQLMHVAFGEYGADKAAQCKKTLSDTIRACLIKTRAGGHKTIAFPALCTGILKYPCSLVAKTLVDTLVRFYNFHNFQGCLETVYIVIPKGDNSDRKGYSKKRVFDEEVSRRRRQADEVVECLVSESAWIFHSRCELTLPSKDDAGRVAKTMNERFKKQKPKPKGPSTTSVK